MVAQPPLTPFNKALLATSLSLCALFILASWSASHGADSPSPIVQSYTQRLLKSAVANDCPDINHCEDKCLCAKQNTNSSLEFCRNDANFLNYLEFHYCVLGKLAPLSFVLLGLWLLILVYFLITTTEQYFCPSLSKLSKRLRLSNNIAGVTFLAFSNGSPDLFGAFSALAHNAPSIGVTSLLGGGVFVTTLVVGAVSLTSPGVNLSRRPFLRDILFYTIATIAFMLIVFDGEIHLWESACFCGFYVLYILGILVTRYVRQRAKRLRREALGIIEDSGEELYEVNEQESDAMPLLDDILFLTNIRSWSSSAKFYKINDDNGGLLDDYEDEEEDEWGNIVPRPTARRVLKSCWYRALSSIGWAELSLRDKLLLVVLWPIALLRALSVPSAGPEGQWSRGLAILSPVAVPMLALFASKEFLHQIMISTFAVPLWSIFLAAGFVFAIVVFFTTSKTEPPRYYMVFIVAGFIASAIWMYLIATEIIALIRTFGRILDIDEGVLGLTVVAWATSIVDLVSNVLVSKQGFTDMAIGACFGAPTFSLLLGLGISVSYVNVKAFPTPYKLAVTDDVWTGFMFLGISLLSSIIFMSINNFKTSYRYGIYLLVVYAAFNVISILNELGVGFLPV
jgi:sodium/potassium/calcium exchanger 6